MVEHHQQTKYNTTALKLQPPSSMKAISSSQLQLILQNLSAGESHRQISFSTGVGIGTISNIRSTHLPDLSKSPGGRPSKLSAKDKKYAASLITKGKTKTAVETAKILSDITNMSIHPQAIRRSLKESGLKAIKKKKKPKLSERHIKARLDFAIKHQYYTEDDWKRFIFSDEVKVNKYGSDWMVWI